MEPAPLHRRVASTGLVRVALAPAAAVALSLALAHAPVLASGLERVPGDPGDARLVNYFLEHTWLWLTGHPLHRRFWDLPMFFPVHGVGAYADTVLGVAAPYWLARALGAGPDRADALWVLTSSALNALAAYAFLRSLLGVGRLAAITGAVLLAAGLPRVHSFYHPQLLGAGWSLAALTLLGVALRGAGTRRGRWAWLGAGACLGAQVWSSFYLSWFLVLGLGVAAVLALALPSLRPQVIRALRSDWPAILGGVAVATGLAVPVLHAWWSAAQVVGLRRAQDVFPTTPLSWLNPGPDSWWYGRWVRGLPGMRGVSAEEQIGVGLVTTAAALAGLWSARRSPGVMVVGLVAGVLVVVTTRLGIHRELWPWSLVSRVVPGALAIRAVSRVGLLVLVAWAAGLALAVQAVRRRSLGWALALAGLCLLEQGATFDHFVPAAERSRAMALGRSVPPGCSAFAYAPDADGWPAWRAQLDAVWATDVAGIPTLNGYTGNIPPGWPLEECLVRGPEDRARISAAVAGWSARHAIPGKVCLVPAP